MRVRHRGCGGDVSVALLRGRGHVLESAAPLETVVEVPIDAWETRRANGARASGVLERLRAFRGRAPRRGGHLPDAGASSYRSGSRLRSCMSQSANAETSAAAAR